MRGFWHGLGIAMSRSGSSRHAGGTNCHPNMCMETPTHNDVRFGPHVDFPGLEIDDGLAFGVPPWAQTRRGCHHQAMSPEMHRHAGSSHVGAVLYMLALPKWCCGARAVQLVGLQAAVCPTRAICGQTRSVLAESGKVGRNGADDGPMSAQCTRYGQQLLTSANLAQNRPNMGHVHKRRITSCQAMGAMPRQPR